MNISICLLQLFQSEGGISYQAISQWEKGIRQIPAKRINELAILFGIPEQYFLEVSESDIEKLNGLIEIKRKNIDDLIQIIKQQNEIDSLCRSVEKALKKYGKNLIFCNRLASLLQKTESEDKA